MFNYGNNQNIPKNKYVFNNNENHQIFPIDSNNYKQQILLNKKNIEDNSLFNISYSSQKKEKINLTNLNNYINKKNNQNKKNNNIQKDLRLIYCLKMLGLNKYYLNFVEKNLNFEGLLALTNNDMAQMKIPLNCQKIIQNFILDYLHFGNLYNLEEIKQYFSKKNNDLKNLNNYKRSYSCDYYPQKTKKFINSNENLRKLNNNNYNNYINEYDKKSYNIINRNKSYNNIRNDINSQYISDYNNKNDNIDNNNNDILLDNFSHIPFNENLELNPHFDKRNINNIKKGSKVDNNLVKNLQHNKIKMIPNNPNAKKNKNIIQKLDEILKKNEKRKKMNLIRRNQSYTNNLNKNKNIEDNSNNKSFGIIENIHKGYYSDNNINIKKMKNNFNITNENHYLNNTTKTTSNNSNNNFNMTNNYEINSFYTGNNSKVTSYAKLNDEDNSSIQIDPDGSPFNLKSSKIKMLKLNQIKEVNQLLENSNNNMKKISKNNNLYSISEKNRGMNLNNHLNSYIYNNYKTDKRNKLKENIIKNNSILMNNNLNNNNIQNNKIKKKYFKNKDNLNYDNLNDIQINNNQNNINNSNYIFNGFGNNMINNNLIGRQNSNKNYQFLETMTNSSLNQNDKRLDITDQEKWKQYYMKNSNKVFNKTQEDINNNINNINIYRNNSLSNNLFSDYQSYYDNYSTESFITNNNNLGNINNINTNINIIKNSNSINNTNNNYINNIPINNHQNENNNYLITPFQQYNKSCQYYNDENNNIIHQNRTPNQQKIKAYSSVKKRKSNKILGNSLNNLLNQDNIQNCEYRINNTNSKQINLSKNMSKNQLKKIKIGINKGYLQMNNNPKGNKNINIKSNNYYKTQNNFYPTNINNKNNSLNVNNYKNMQINSNYYNNDIINYNINNNYY